MSTHPDPISPTNQAVGLDRDRVVIRAIHTGDELLDGRIEDTNARWLGAQLAQVGARLAGVTTVGDDEDTIRAALVSAAQGADWVIIGGGLGPTSDDRTRDAIAAACDAPLELRADARATLESFFASRGVPMPETNLRQVLFPRHATLRANPRGTASAFEIRWGACRVLAVPGVPGEYRACLRDHLLPHVATAHEPTRTWALLGLPESEAARRLQAVEEIPGIRVSYRAAMPWLHVGIRGAPDVLSDATARALDALGSHTLGDGVLGPAESVVASLIALGQTVATAESCTGGGLAEWITAVPGSSALFERGWVTYSNAAKVKELGVSSEQLDGHGAVSRPVAEAMAYGARHRAGTTWGVSITGIAGPTGGTTDKPVGTVWCACAGPGEKEGWVVRLRLGARRRETVRSWTQATALFVLDRVSRGATDDIRALPWVELLEPLRGDA
jgi:nicotinamide-nucleotide amidase